MGGAGGTVGAAAAAKAPADGYTFFVGAIHHTIAESIYAKLTYNIERDFEPVTVLAYVPNVIVIHPKHAGIRTYADFLAYAKANPGKLNFGSARQRHLAPPGGRALQAAHRHRPRARAVQGRRRR